jgi:hypothetical protein
MFELPREVIEGLGFDPGTAFEEVGGSPAPEGSVGYGRGVAALRPVEDYVETASFTEATVGGFGRPVRRVADEPALVMVDTGIAPPRVHGRFAVLHGGAVLVDSRTEPAHVRVPDGLLVIQAGNVSYVLPLPEVRLESWLGAETIQPWLEQLVRQLGKSPSLLSRAAAAGHVARLWAPARDPLASFQRLVAAGETPATAAVRWFQHIHPVQRRRVEQAALFEADTLAEELPWLQRHAAEEPGAARDAIRSWLHRRDDLASVAHVLGDGNPEVSRSLERLDRAASLRMTALSSVRFPDDERLGEVALQEPESWWGTFATPDA